MSGGLMSGGLMSGGLMSGGLMSGGLESGGLKSYDSTEMSHYHSCLAVRMHFYRVLRRNGLYVQYIYRSTPEIISHRFYPNPNDDIMSNDEASVRGRCITETSHLQNYEQLDILQSASHILTFSFLR